MLASPIMSEIESKKRKRSLYFPEEMLAEIIAESNRLDRPISWVVHRAWKLAREHIQKLPGA